MPPLSFLSTLPPKFQHLELITPTTPKENNISWFDFLDKLRNELGWKPDGPKVTMQFQLTPEEHFVLEKEIAKFFGQDGQWEGRNLFLRDTFGTLGIMGFLNPEILKGGLCKRVEVETRRSIFEEPWEHWRG